MSSTTRTTQRPPASAAAPVRSGSSHQKRARKQDGDFEPAEEIAQTPVIAPPTATSVQTYSMDTDISLLEAPTFTTLERGPSQTMLSLSWDHPANLIGKKVSSVESS
jgi:hypothetical protein